MKVIIELDEKELAIIKANFAVTCSDFEFCVISTAIDRFKDSSTTLDLSAMKPENAKVLASLAGVAAIKQLANTNK